MMLNRLHSAHIAISSLLFVACAAFDETPRKSPQMGLIATPASYYSTPKARYIAVKYKENLDRMIEQIVRNPKTANLQFANNISSVGGIGFFTHAATKTSDERYLEVILGVPEVFETKGEYSDKLFRLFTLYGVELLAIMVADSDIYQEKEVSGYGLNLSWRQVNPDPTGTRVTLERLVAYFSKEEARKFIKHQVKQTDLLAKATVFGVDEGGPMKLVSFRAEEIKSDSRAEIREETIAGSKSEREPGVQPTVKNTPAKTIAATFPPENKLVEKTEQKLTSVEKVPPSNDQAVSTPTQSKQRVPPGGIASPPPGKSPPRAVSTLESHEVAAITNITDGDAAEAKMAPSLPQPQAALENEQEVDLSTRAPAMAEGHSLGILPEDRGVVLSERSESKDEGIGAPGLPGALHSKGAERQILAAWPAQSSEPRESSKAVEQTAPPAKIQENMAGATKPIAIKAGPAVPERDAQVINTSPTPLDRNMSKPDSALKSEPARVSPNKTQTNRSFEETLPPAIEMNAAKSHDGDPRGAPTLSSAPFSDSRGVDEPAPDKSTLAKPPVQIANKFAAPLIAAEPRHAEGSNTLRAQGTAKLGSTAKPMSAPVPDASAEKSLNKIGRTEPQQIALLKNKPDEALAVKQPAVRPARKALEGYVIQLAFTDKSAAKRWAESFERRGFAVSLTEAGSSGSVRVRLGNFAARDEAERRLQSLRQDGLKGIVINLPQAYQPQMHSAASETPQKAMSSGR